MTSELKFATDPFIGGLKQFSNLSDTFTKARAKTVTVLPTKLVEIDFYLNMKNIP